MSKSGARGQKANTNSGFFWPTFFNNDRQQEYRCHAVILTTAYMLVAMYALTNHNISHWRPARDNIFLMALVMPPMRQCLPKGAGPCYACVILMACALVFHGVYTNRPQGCLPAIALMASDIVSNVADAIVSVGLIHYYATFSRALTYALVSFVVIGLELYLWLGLVSHTVCVEQKRRTAH